MKAQLSLPPGTDGSSWLVGPGLRRIASHHHDELELNLVVCGRAHYLFEQRRISITTGSMLWIFPRQEHVLFDWSHDFSMWVLVFKPGLVRRLSKPARRRILRSADPGDIFSRQIDFREVEILDHIYRDAGKTADDPDLARTALEFALVRSWHTYVSCRDAIPRTNVHPAVAKAARLLALTDEPIQLEQLATKAGLSPARLSRLFKQQVGINLSAFRQQECLKRFIALYGTGARHSLIEAALQAGFGSYAQFHRVFRRMVGVGPAFYRKSLKSAPPQFVTRRF